MVQRVRKDLPELPAPLARKAQRVSRGQSVHRALKALPAQPAPQVHRD